MPRNGYESADELQARMRELRQELKSDVSRTTAAARQLTDWRYYFRQFPWYSAAAIAAIGFIAVPRKRERPLVDEAALQKMINEKRVVVIPQKTDMAKKGVFASIGGLLATVVTRMAVSYASQRFSELNTPGTEENTPMRMRTPK